MQHGFEGTSMRLLTAKAGVNLAAVNYHFGSKDALIEALFRRRLDPMNAERIAALDALEDFSAENIIRAFVGPSLRLIEDAKGGGRNFIRLLGRTYTEPAKAVRGLIGQMYAPTMQRYKAALERALPQMPRRRAGLAHALHVRHPRLHACRHRHGAAHRGVQAGRSSRRAPARGAPDCIPHRGAARAAQDFHQEGSIRNRYGRTRAWRHRRLFHLRLLRPADRVVDDRGGAVRLVP